MRTRTRRGRGATHIIETLVVVVMVSFVVVVVVVWGMTTDVVPAPDLGFPTATVEKESMVKGPTAAYTSALLEESTKLRY